MLVKYNLPVPNFSNFSNPQKVSYRGKKKTTRSQALQMYTTWGAFASFKENEIGRLKEGYRADLVILDRDISRVPVKDLIKTRVLATYVHGEQVFGATNFE
jgi:predicted amidohydrolase YtcJ